MISDPEGRHCRNRLLEWTSAMAMVAFGCHIMLVPNVMQQSRYSSILLIVSGATFASLCISVGVIRIIALIKNGSWPAFGPRLRAVMAMMAAVIWGQIAVSLTQHGSPGMWVYYALVCAELRSVWRARRDANGPRYL